MKKATIIKDGVESLTFNIPDGASLQIEEGITIISPETKQVEPIKYVPKIGDCVKCYTEIGTVLFGEVTGIDSDVLLFDSAIRNDSVYTNESWFLNGDTEEKITPDQLQSEYKKLGYEYNFETHEAKKLDWVPCFHCKYYFVDGYGDIEESVWNNDEVDNGRILLKNVHQTEEQCEKYKQYLMNYQESI